jgi:hypothetical protein
MHRAGNQAALKIGEIKMTLQNYTQAKIDAWYKNAKRDYDKNGSAKVEIIEGKMVIEADEDGEKLHFISGIYADENVDYYFNCWMEDPNNSSAEV